MIACGGTAGCKNQIRNRVEDASSQPFLTLKYRENPVLQDSRLTPPGVKEQMNYPAALASFFARVRAHAWPGFERSCFVVAIRRLRPISDGRRSSMAVVSPGFPRH